MLSCQFQLGFSSVTDTFADTFVGDIDRLITMRLAVVMSMWPKCHQSVAGAPHYLG